MDVKLVWLKVLNDSNRSSSFVPSPGVSGMTLNRERLQVLEPWTSDRILSGRAVSAG